MKTIRFALLACAALNLSAQGAAQAETYPGDKPIKIVAAFSPGSATDTSARIIAEELRKDLNANVIVENKPGAQGLIGTEYAVRSPGDGYTLTISSSSLNSINPGLFKKLPYDAQKDFSHVSRLTTMPMLLLVRADGPYKDLATFVKQAASGSLNYGYGSPGGQVGAAAFNRIAGVRAEGVPYKSQPPALTDLAGGQVDYVMADLSVATPLLRGGKLRALAISTERRLPDLPDVPTFAETEYKDFDLVVWVGLAGPAGIPQPILERLNKAVNEALARPEVQQKFAALGMTAAPNTQAQQRAFVEAQLGTWGRRMQEANIKPE
ncbi:Bug family tripartite tricarboxylate transporter substrate binding protein [Achromobacter anxifer]